MLGSFCLTSCTVRTGGHITKVNPYHLQPGRAPVTEDQMIDFEYRRKVHGAVNAKDFHERYGNYYAVYWKAENRNVPATVRLQYRQARTGPKIFILEKTVANPNRNNTTKFEIIGDTYCENGAVTQWKASIVQEGKVVDECKSFLWK